MTDPGCGENCPPYFQNGRLELGGPGNASWIKLCPPLSGLSIDDVDRIEIAITLHRYQSSYPQIIVKTWPRWIRRGVNGIWINSDNDSLVIQANTVVGVVAWGIELDPLVDDDFVTEEWRILVDVKLYQSILLAGEKAVWVDGALDLTPLFGLPPEDIGLVMELSLGSAWIDDFSVKTMQY